MTKVPPHLSWKDTVLARRPRRRRSYRARRAAADRREVTQIFLAGAAVIGFVVWLVWFFAAEPPLPTGAQPPAGPTKQGPNPDLDPRIPH